ncbi:CapA family protein [Candidatus Saccharibacteria bacterium]|nr:CapA family protein [Candidatus Saccharibacteria bacterium]
MKKICIGMFCCIVVGLGVFFGAQFILKVGVFAKPGEVIYEDSLLNEEIAVLDGIFQKEDLVLKKDVAISARNELSLPNLESNEILYSVSVPVTDFYSTETNIDVERVDELFNNCLDCTYTLIDVNDLAFGNKLLKINGEYYLDTFRSGAVFRILKFDSQKFDEEIKPLIAQLSNKQFPTESNVMTFAQTGVTAFSRLMNAKMNEVDSGEYFAEGLARYLSKYDFTHTSNEASFSDWAPTSGATGTPICSDLRFIDTLNTIGLDIVELTGNHNLDCGIEAANNTIDIYNANQIMIVGGGKDADSAASPLNFGKKGTNITMLAFNESTGGATYGDTPGANQYYEETAAAQITNAKERGDFVIVDMQYYECSAYVADYEDPTCDYAWATPGDEIGFFRHLIDLGADVIVGTSAHQPQTFELYGNGVIYYGLGNLFFDQYRWPGTTRSLILVHHFYDGKLLQTEIVPTVYDDSFQTSLMDEETKAWYLERLASERPED